MILNVVLLIAVGVLYVLHFSKSDGASEENIQNVVQTATAGMPQIAYVNSDSLLSKYQFFKDKAEELEAKRTKLEAEFNNRARGLQNEVSNLQANAQNMTMAQAQAAQENLMKKEQNLMQYQQSLQQQLMRDESAVNNELYEKVSGYLQEYGRKNNYQLVLTYAKGSGVWYAHDSLNITDQVIAGLNEAYKKPADTATTDTTESK